ncbi:MAG: DUF805 domain-containing protein [Pseudomonadota bacterium]
MAALHWLLLPLRRYAQFSGRSRRQEFWPFTIVTGVASIGCDTIDEIFGLQHGFPALALGAPGMLGSAFTVVTLLPGVALAVRRLHDIDRAGWWLAPPMAIIIGGMIVLDSIFGIHDHPNGQEMLALTAMLAVLASMALLFVVFCLEGTAGPNRFGDDPKRAGHDGVFD